MRVAAYGTWKRSHLVHGWRRQSRHHQHNVIIYGLLTPPSIPCLNPLSSSAVPASKMVHLCNNLTTTNYVLLEQVIHSIIDIEFFICLMATDNR